MANTKILDQQVIQVAMTDKILTPQTLYTLNIDAGTLTATGRLRVSATVGRVFNLSQTCPEPLTCCPVVALTEIESFPADFAVADSFSTYTLDGKVYEYSDESTTTIDFSGNNRASWGGFVGDNDEMYILIRDASAWGDGYPAAETIVHFTSEGTREQISPVVPDIGVDGFGVGTLTCGNSDEHCYMVNSVYYSLTDNSEHYFESEHGSAWGKLGDDFYWAGDTRIGASTSEVRRYSASGAGVFPGSGGAPAVTSVNFYSTVGNTISRGISSTGTTLFVSFGSYILALDPDDLSLQDTIDTGLSVKAIYAVSDTLVYFITGGPFLINVYRWTDTGGVEKITSTTFSSSPGAANIFLAQGFTGSGLLSYKDGFLYVSANGFGGVSTDIAKIGVLSC